MAKNTDPQTLALFQAVKAAYFKHLPGTIRNNADGRPVSVDMMDKILNGRPIDGITIAEDTDIKQVIDIMPGYRCSLQALPRIYKGVARLAGETAEKIQMAKNTLPPFGILPQMATAKENKKAFTLIKKYCKPDTIHPYFGYVFHDPARRCAVWSNGYALICSRNFYNPAAAGLCVDMEGMTAPDGFKYPKYADCIPEFINPYRLNTDTVINNCAAVPASKTKKLDYNQSPTPFNIGIIKGEPVGFNPAFLPFFKAIESNIYIRSKYTSRMAAGWFGHGGGFILLMPCTIPEECKLSENVVYHDPETDTVINGYVQTGDTVKTISFLPSIEETPATAQDTATASQETATATETTTAEPQPAPIPTASQDTATASQDTATATETTTAEPQPAPILTASQDTATATETATAEPQPAPIPTASQDTTTATETATAEPQPAPVPTASQDATTSTETATAEPQPAPIPTGRRRPVVLPIRRWLRVAAVLLPLVIVVSFLTASAQTPPDTTTTTPPPQPEAPARVITLPAVTITDTATTNQDTATATAEPQPAPITLPAVTITDTTDGTPSSQKTATADTPSSQKTDTDGTPSSQKTDTATTSPSHTITLCAGTAWQYTMTQYA
jgi:hypothetical protein